MCEGNCKLFTVPKSFYHSKDKNKRRKKTKLNFIAESQIPKSNKAKDKMVKGVPKFKPVQGIKYKKASQRLARAWLLLIEETEKQEPIRKIEPNVEQDRRTSQNELPVIESKILMMTSSKEENNVKKENTRSRRSTVQNKEVETRPEKLTKKPETQDNKIKE